MDTKIRILHTIWSGRSGGAERFIRDIVTYSDKEIFEHEVCFLSKGGPFAKQIADSKIPVYYLGMKTGFSFFNAIKLAGIIKKTSPHIIFNHTRNYFTNLLILFFPWTKKVYFEHGGNIDGNITDKEKRIYFYFYNCFIRFYSLILTNSNYIKDKIVEATKIKPERISVFYYGIDAGKYKNVSKDPASKTALGIPQDHKVFGMIGRLTEQKGIDDFIIIALEIKKLCDKCSFIVIGEGELRQELERTALKHNLDIKFLGDRRDVPELLSIFDIYIFSSKWEPFGIVVLESLAAGVPVVGFSVPGMKEIIEQGGGGILIDSRDHRKVAEAALGVLADKERYGGLSKKGSANVNANFEIKKTIETLGNMLKDVIGYGKVKACMISPLGYTGIAYYDHCLCQALSDTGADITLITSRKRVVNPAETSYKIKKLFVNTYGDISRIKKGLAYILGMAKAYLYVVKNSFKIVHFQILELPVIDLIFLIMFKMSGVKVVFTPHDIYSFKFKKNKKTLKAFYKLSDAIVAHNTANKDYLADEFNIPKDKIDIITQGNYNLFLDAAINKDRARENLGIPKDKKVILLFGSIRQGKGIKTAVNAVKLLKNNKELMFIIAGKPVRGYDMQALRKELSGEPLKDIAVLKDHFIEHDKVESYYKSSDAVIIPYERIYESAVVKYAFSCGLPVVLSDLPEFSSFAKHKENCLIFKAGDPVDLADKVSILLRNKELSYKIASEAKKLSDTKWDWSKIAYKTRKLYYYALSVV